MGSLWPSGSPWWDSAAGLANATSWDGEKRSLRTCGERLTNKSYWIYLRLNGASLEWEVKWVIYHHLSKFQVLEVYRNHSTLTSESDLKGRQLKNRHSGQLLKSIFFLGGSYKSIKSQFSKTLRSRPLVVVETVDHKHLGGLGVESGGGSLLQIHHTHWYFSYQQVELMNYDRWENTHTSESDWFTQHFFFKSRQRHNIYIYNPLNASKCHLNIRIPTGWLFLFLFFPPKKDVFSMLSPHFWVRTLIFCYQLI